MRPLLHYPDRPPAPPRGRLVTLFLALCVTLTLAGCFRLGVPEYFAPVSQRDSPLSRLGGESSSPGGVTLPRALVLIPDDSNQRETFGTQFVVGIFPLSQVYLQNSAQTMLQEVLISTLQQQGYEVVTSSPANLIEARSLFNPTLVIKPQLRDLNLSAYDALFLRVVKLSGGVSLSLFQTDSNEPSTPTKELRADLAQTWYRKSAFGPYLSFALKRELGRTVENLLSSLPKTRHAPPINQPTYPAGAPSITILAPLFNPNSSSSIDPTLGKIVASSYGFDSEPPYSPAQLARIFQRGLAQGAREGGARVFSLLNTSQPSAASARSAPASWTLTSSLVEAKFKNSSAASGELQLTADFSLTESTIQGNRSKTTRELARARCQTVVSAPRGVDGIWVQGLTEGASQLITALLNKKCDP